MRGSRAIVSLVLVLCCTNSEPVAPTIESLVGTWPIRTVDGSVVPAIIAQANGHTLRIISDTLFLRANGTFVRSTVTTDSSQGFIVIDTSAGGAGTFTLFGNTLTLFFQGGGLPATGFINGTTLSLTREGSQFLFEKQ